MVRIMEEQQQRFVSLTKAGPVDVVDDDQAEIHADLETWGRWSLERRSGVRCGSAENGYRSGWRSWHYPSAEEMMPSIPNPRARAVDRAVLGLPDQHRTAIRLYYVFKARPEVICRQVVIRHQDFGRWMRDCRCMVLNRLRFDGA